MPLWTQLAKRQALLLSVSAFRHGVSDRDRCMQEK
ncbi:hypothetical protein FPSE_10127 [Fusarium pseudograminearum CS3096]|uniref:Uncharacterized protein n=1 Tax=Fusarium pseudograminearum (strain CS3096) TaxID=1028729 RepID=K3VBM7_FUSPC|nr:hypothetical protein FPSE_10127 [Fusarium pseudograminearum CS3096]EKJ69713.1 hypothetical protein FPSE_10127 [Fusarium pseudograminearum CS3096]